MLCEIGKKHYISLVIADLTHQFVKTTKMIIIPENCLDIVVRIIYLLTFWIH